MHRNATAGGAACKTTSSSAESFRRGACRLNQTELEVALARGARLALRRALRWSAGELWPGDTGAENLLQVSIADAIHRTAAIKPAIQLEPTLSRIDEEAFEGDSRRIDIGLKWQGSVGASPRYFSVIEIKKHPARYDEDLRKICNVLERVESVRHGYLVTYFQKHEPDRYAKRSIDDQIEAAADAIAEATESAHRRGCAHVGVAALGRIRGQEGTWRAAALITRFDRM